VIGGKGERNLKVLLTKKVSASGSGRAGGRVRLQPRANKRETLRQLASFHNLDAQFQPACIVKIQDLDRCAPDRCQARHARAFEGEMVGPAILPRVKKPGDFCRLRVDSGRVRALSEIAAVACERQIFRIAGSAVLLRDDVLDMVPQLALLLTQPAVFATLVCATADKVPRCRVHLLLNNGVEMLTSLELQDRDEVRRVDERLVFRALTVRQATLISALGEFVDALLHGRVNLEIDHAARGLGIETAA